MRGDFSTIKRKIGKRSGTDRINKPIDGYPLLHHLLMVIRDRSAPRERKRWIDLLNTMLENPRVNKNV